MGFSSRNPDCPTAPPPLLWPKVRECHIHALSLPSSRQATQPLDTTSHILTSHHEAPRGPEETDQCPHHRVPEKSASPRFTVEVTWPAGSWVQTLVCLLQSAIKPLCLGRKEAVHKSIPTAPNPPKWARGSEMHPGRWGMGTNGTCQQTRSDLIQYLLSFI